MSCDRIVPAIANPLVGVRSDAELLDFADRCAQSVREGGADEVLAESSRKLIIAVTALLRDWFASADYTPLGMTTLLSMALMRGKYDNAANFAFRKTPLDLMFNQIESGEKYTKDANGIWGWRKSSFMRGEDGARPADTKGMPWGSDIALSFYKAWQTSAEPSLLEDSIRECLLWTSSLGFE